MSYELSIAGKRFIVDSGVDDYYGDLDWRAYYRSTSAHNTVVVDAVDQSEVWDRFRVARRARPLDVAWQRNEPSLDYVTGSHSGYRRLAGNVMHQRWVCWVERKFWLICDHISGDGEHQIESLIHFHPEIEIISAPDVASKMPGQVQRDGVNLTVAPWGLDRVSTYFGNCNPIQGWYSPEFGIREPNHVWGLRRRATLPVWMGYVIGPHTTNITVQPTVEDVNTLTISVLSDDDAYLINLDNHKVKVKKIS